MESRKSRFPSKLKQQKSNLKSKKKFGANFSKFSHQYNLFFYFFIKFLQTCGSTLLMATPSRCHSSTSHLTEYLVLILLVTLL